MIKELELILYPPQPLEPTIDPILIDENFYDQELNDEEKLFRMPSLKFIKHRLPRVRHFDVEHIGHALRIMLHK